MTWNERRIITVLCAVLALLSAALLVVLGLRYREKRDMEETNTPVITEPQKGEESLQAVNPFIALTYYNGETTLSFHKKENGAWIWNNDNEFPLDTTTMFAILDALNNWAPQQTITDPAVIADSGVGTHVGTLKATTDTGAMNLVFGKTTDDGRSRYVQVNDDESTVYIIDDALYKLMQIPIYDMYTLPEMPELSEDIIQSVIIRGATAEDGTLGLSTSLTAQRPEGELTGEASWRSGGANVSSIKLVRDLLADLTSISLTRCVLYRPSEEAEVICGFDRPTMLYISYVTETEETAMLEIQIGSHLPDGSGRYIRLAGSSTVYSLPTATLDPLMHISLLGLDG